MMKKIITLVLAVMVFMSLSGCGTNADTSAQTRTDLTAAHIRGLDENMARTDVEDLLGQHDSDLASHETVHYYSLADGNTAILRYVDDKLVGTYIRDKDGVEETLFNRYARSAATGTTTGTTTDETNK